MIPVNCRYFTGYKPCGRNSLCNEFCPERKEIKTRILLVHLGALGAVVRSTGLLKMIHKKYPKAHVTWVTQKPADQLLLHNDLVDRILTTESCDLLKLRALRFDVAMVIDKSLEASGILSMTEFKKIFGFVADSISGAIIPANVAANELWQIGLDDEFKFYKNKKTELQLTAESLELPLDSAQSGYYVPMSDEEKLKQNNRKKIWSENGKKKVLGINTGCSDMLPAKKLSIQQHRLLIEKLLINKNIQIVLLGGREDKDRNQEIAEGFSVIQSPTDLGLRDGLLSVSSCDVIFTGDSLGMHMAISQNIETIAWFGPSCAHEIDFFSNGEAILTQAKCSPCWKRSCQKPVMCYDLLDLDEIVQKLNWRLSTCQADQSQQEIQVQADDLY